MVLDVIKKRFSVRKFKDKPIEEGKIIQLLKDAQLAPSARNYQNWYFIVIKDEEKRAQLPEICKGQEFVGKAPITIAYMYVQYRLSNDLW